MLIETYRDESFNITKPVKVSLGKGTMWYICSDECEGPIIGSGNPARVRSLARDINKYLERGEEKITIATLSMVFVG